MNIKKASKDVKYEIEMLRWTADLLLKPNFFKKVSTTIVEFFPIQSKNPHFLGTVHDALLESFAVHTRNLFYFFYTKTNKRKKDDVLAEDYLINKKEFITQRTNKTDLKHLTKRVDKMIVHITYHRAVYNKKTKLWMVADIRKKMDKTIDAFINTLPNEQKIWFK